jgi:peptidoglycan/xylan/chitin deacetylase (PgdA/CDA1 family)
MTTTVKRALRITGALEVMRRMTAAGRIDILLYHGFCEGSVRDRRFPKLMPVGLFERQLQLLVRHARPLYLGELANGANQGVVLTFDDGYASNYHLAFPVLQKHGFPATIFLTTGFVDRTVPLWGDRLEFLLASAPCRDTSFEWRNEHIALPLAAAGVRDAVVTELKQHLHEMAIADIHDFLGSLEGHLGINYEWDRAPQALRPLDWDQIRAMRRSGLVSFGSHTVSHPVLSRCPDAVQEYEIVESKNRVETELGESCPIFAYPYGKNGDFSEVTKRIAAQAGNTLVLTAESGSNVPSPAGRLDLKRWGADIGADELCFIVSGGPAFSGYARRTFRH